MARIRVTLKWIKILDKLEPFFKETGEFRFRSRVSSENSGGLSEETRFPEEGHYSLSDKPGWNFVTLNKVLFEGDVEDHLVVDLFGEEIDVLSANDELDRYRRSSMGRSMTGQDSTSLRTRDRRIPKPYPTGASATS